MSHEINGEISNEDFKWFESQFSEDDEFDPEADCSSRDLQLARNLYYGSSGSEIDIAKIDILRINTLVQRYDLEPLQDTKLGYVCLQHKPGRAFGDYEFIYLCGMIYAIGCTPRHHGLQVRGDNIWPSSGRGDVIENYFNGTPNILLNRAVTNYGHLAVRYTFTESELTALPASFKTDRDFLRCKYKIGSKLQERFVMREVSITDRVVQLTADSDGTKYSYF